MPSRITLIGHSGVLLQHAGCALVFDYYRGAFPMAALQTADRRVIFASHGHSDHYNPVIHDHHAALPGSHLVLGHDIDTPLPHVSLAPGETLDLDGVTVRAFGSTDQGVSFHVTAGGLRIFHAGDLNLWSWLDESTPEEIAQARADFAAVLHTLTAYPVDVACFPLDKRMGRGFDEGIAAYCAALKPKYLLPIHSFGVHSTAARWQCPTAGITVLRPTQNGDCFDLEV